MPTESVIPEAKSAVDGTRACPAARILRGPQPCAVGLAGREEGGSCCHWGTPAGPAMRLGIAGACGGRDYETHRGGGKVETSEAHQELRDQDLIGNQTQVKPRFSLELYVWGC